MPTAQSVIDEALKELRVYQSDSAPTTAEYDDALVRLNAMMEQWASDISSLGYSNINTASPADWTNPITLGASGDIAMTRPTAIMSLAYQLNTAQPFEPLDLMPLPKLDEFSARQLSDSAKPVAAHYRPSYSNGTLYLSPSPTTGTLRIQSLAPRYTWATLTTNISLAPGLKRAIYLNLAVDLAGQYQVEVGADLKEAAQRALDAWTTLAEA